MTCCIVMCNVVMCTVVVICAIPSTPDMYCGGVLFGRRPSSSEVRGFVIHDINEVEGVRQQEEQ